MGKIGKQYFGYPGLERSPGHLASAIRCGEWIHISGQGPLDMATLQYIPGTIEEETAMTLAHIEKILQGAGGEKAQIVKCTSYLADLGTYDGYHRAFREFFGDLLPCRTTVGAPLLRGIQVEIDAVAFLG